MTKVSFPGLVVKRLAIRVAEEKRTAKYGFTSHGEGVWEHIQRQGIVKFLLLEENESREK